MGNSVTTDLPVAKTNITGLRCMSCLGTVTLQPPAIPFSHLVHNFCWECQDENKLKKDLERRDTFYRKAQRLPQGPPKLSGAREAYDKARLAYANYMFKKEKEESKRETLQLAESGSKKRDRSLVSPLTSPTQQKKHRRVDELGDRVQKAVHFDDSHRHRSVEEN